jgi:hypothetical protein
VSTTVALIDDEFDPLITQSYTRFDTALSRNLGVGLPTDLSEPVGSLHGTTTSAEIGDPGNTGRRSASRRKPRSLASRSRSATCRSAPSPMP